MPYNDAIRVDETPIDNSEALITSGGVAEAIAPFYLKPVILDFTKWSSGIFVETLDEDYECAFEIDFDRSGRPIRFTDSVGHVTDVEWD